MRGWLQLNQLERNDFLIRKDWLPEEGLITAWTDNNDFSRLVEMTAYSGHTSMKEHLFKGQRIWEKKIIISNNILVL